MVMDFLRSAYRVNMILDDTHALYLVDWFRASPGASLFPGVHPISLNWSKPDFGDLNQVGEVRTFKPVYSKGGKPTFVPHDVSWPATGLLDWFRTGAPGPLATTYPLVWDGSRSGPLNPPGIFPPQRPGLPYPTLTSSTRGVATLTQPYFGTWQWSWPNPPQPVITWVNYRPLITSLPWTCIGLMPAFGQLGTFYLPLKCTTYTAATNTSTWSDPANAVLAANEVLTIVTS